ncbi:MAG: GreA/GreB family elongation factor [Patescibacteria group bacterium]|jgi:transcription elongation factor GreA
MQVPKRKPGKYAPGPADYHLTPEAMQALKDEMERIVTKIQPKAVEELRRTREMGDLSENFAYSAAKAKVGGLEMRVLEIKERLRNAIPIRRGAAADGSVRIGASVEVEVNGKTKVYDVVGSQETNPGSGAISYLSPLGEALMGHKAGEIVKISAGGKEVIYKILGVR